MRRTCICIQLRLRAALATDLATRVTILSEVPTACPTCERDREAIRALLIECAGGPIPRSRLLRGVIPSFLLDDMVASGELREGKLVQTGGRPVRYYWRNS